VREAPGNAPGPVREDVDCGHCRLEGYLELYSMWQEYFRKHQPPTLIVWGKNDGTFTVEGARLYTKDLKNAEFHLFDTGHFALEEDLEEMASLIRDFLGRTSATK
jgi:pimeloyl-ACP methyl ester carboxylesterase